MENSKLINGDCLEELKKLDDGSIDLLCTDPPYGYGFMGKHWDTFQEKKSTKDFDKAAEDLRLATRHLGMIVGKVDVEELLGSIFSDFCIGK